jgi:hypothetical protein
MRLKPLHDWKSSILGARKSPEPSLASRCEVIISAHRMAHTANSTTAMADNKLPFDEKPEDLPNSCNMELERSSGTITSIPDEVITHNNRRKFQFGRVQSLFNGHHPPVSIFGISRKKLIVIAMAIIISLLALILGLSIGLTHHKAQYVIVNCRVEVERANFA